MTATPASAPITAPCPVEVLINGAWVYATLTAILSNGRVEVERVGPGRCTVSADRIRRL